MQNTNGVFEHLNNQLIHWYQNEILENKFIEFYSDYYELKYIDNNFYTINGFKSESEISQEIQNILSKVVDKSLASRVRSLISALKNYCFEESEVEYNTIYTKNQKLIIEKNKLIIGKNKTVANRLNVTYEENCPLPKKWLEFLSELFTKTQIEILQLYLGACLIANTNIQKMLLVIGQSGIGKSRITEVMKLIFGNTFLPRGIHDLFDDNNRFALAGIAHKLLIFDDEIDSNYYITDSRNLKVLITGSQVKSEQKHEKALTVTPIAKVIALGNHNIKVKDKDLESIMRRSIVLKTKNKNPNRIDNLLIDKELAEEINLIFNWMFQGTLELVNNDFHFKHEEYIRNEVINMFSDNIVHDINNRDYIHLFLSNEQYVALDGYTKAPTIDIYSTYQLWAKENAEETVCINVFSKDLSSVSNQYNLKYKSNMSTDIGRRNGYVGIFLKQQ